MTPFVVKNLKNQDNTIFASQGLDVEMKDLVLGLDPETPPRTKVPPMTPLYHQI